MLPVIAFYVLSAFVVGAAFMVVAARNPVHAVMYLILTFFSAAGLFILMGAEFLALLLIMVYVGAVAVLFMFVVMMLDVDFVELKKGFLQHVPMGVVVGGVLLTEMILVGAYSLAKPSQGVILAPKDSSNIKELGNVLYTEYAFFFEGVGLVLLVALIGAIVLTLRTREGVKRQNIADQIARTREEGVELVDVESGEGIGS
ncbi:MAG: NADH:ubiquinone oxidoreductase subunit J [Robiginitomaculum sp.]|nr:MAG: NADH:ubiquinone oxidoreductase subunit J [Robiginitomaculum sp.]